ncbi:unnamed protein product [Caenorhabditis brenneri]
MFKLNQENVDLVSTHSFYGNISKYPSKDPIVAGDDCGIAVSCEGDYQLVILDQASNVTMNYGAQSANATCTSSKSWLVKNDGETVRVQGLAAVCVNYKSCTPKTPTTFLFAYSNDIESGVISSLLSLLKSEYDFYGNVAPEFTTFAHVRFDLEVEEDIKYHSSVKDFFTTTNSQAPSPSFVDPAKGSSILEVLQKHISNAHAPICGSRIVAFTQRPLVDQDTEEIANQFSNHHISLFTVSFTQNNSAWEVTKFAAKTPGYGTISNKKLYPLYSTPFWDPFYCIYAEKVTVSGKQTVELREMKVPYEGLFTMVYSTDSKAEGTNFIELEWVNPSSTNSWSMVPNSDNANYNTISQFNYLDPVIYNMTIRTSFGDSEPHDVHVRVYGTEPISYWASP